ncbi:MAG: protein kinase [Bryobacteraceae bacterium]
MALRAGDTIGDYRVLDLLGAGGMGNVYRVQNILSNRVEAMKVVLPDKSDELNERFLREIQVQASLIHPNITGLHTAMRIDGQLIMIMELVDGETVRERLGRGPFRVGECVEYGRQILDALSYAHRRDIVHRDIKPANIMLTKAGQAKLMDFGLASAGFDRRLTRTGAVMGSIYYMAPEQVRGELLTAKSDLYSFGLTMYEMLTGVRGIQGDSDYAIMTAHLQLDPTPPVVCNPDVPGPLSDLVLRAIAKDANDRFASAEEFRDALEKFARSAPAPYLQSTALETEAPAPPVKPVTRTLLVNAEGDATVAMRPLIAIPKPVPEAEKPAKAAEPAPAQVQPAIAQPVKPETPTLAVAAESKKSSGLWIGIGAAAVVVFASVGIYRMTSNPPSESPAAQTAEPVVEPAASASAVNKTGLSPTAVAPAPSARIPEPKKVASTRQEPARTPATAVVTPIPAPAPAPVVEPPKPPQKTPEQLAAEEAARVWETLALSTDPAALRSFHARFPQSPHAAEALSLAQRLEAQAAEAAARKSAEANAALRQEVTGFLRRIEAAYSSKDIRQVRTLWPTIGSEHVTRLQDTFNETRAVTLSLEPSAEPRITQNGAVVECRYMLIGQLKNAKVPRRAEGTATVRLTRSGNAWLVEDIDYRTTSRSLFRPL